MLSSFLPHTHYSSCTVCLTSQYFEPIAQLFTCTVCADEVVFAALDAFTSSFLTEPVLTATTPELTLGTAVVWRAA